MNITRRRRTARRIANTQFGRLQLWKLIGSYMAHIGGGDGVRSPPSPPPRHTVYRIEHLKKSRMLHIAPHHTHTCVYKMIRRHSRMLYTQTHCSCAAATTKLYRLAQMCIKQIALTKLSSWQNRKHTHTHTDQLRIYGTAQKIIGGSKRRARKPCVFYKTWNVRYVAVALLLLLLMKWYAVGWVGGDAGRE